MRITSELWRRTLAAVAIAAALAATADGAERSIGIAGADRTQRKPGMSDAQRKAMELVRLKDEQYYALDTKALRALQARLAEMLEPAGSSQAGAPQPQGPEPVLALGAPARIAAEQAARIPVVTAARFSDRREWEAEYKQNQVYVVADLGTGKVTAGFPTLRDKVRPPPPSQSTPPPDAESALDSFTSVELRDLMHLLGGLAAPTRLNVTVLYYNWMSNTVAIDVAGSGGRPVPEKRRTDVAKTGSAIDAIPSDAPAAVSFSIGDTAGASGAIAVRAAANVPAGAAGLMASKDAPGGPLLPVSVLLVQRDKHRPLQADFAVPATLVRQGSPSQAAQAVFAFDLRTAFPASIAPGTYQVYLVVGGLVGGPRPLTIGKI